MTPEQTPTPQVNDLREALTLAVMPLEVLALSGRINDLSRGLQDAVRMGIEAAKAALAAPIPAPSPVAPEAPKATQGEPTAPVDMGMEIDAIERYIHLSHPYYLEDGKLHRDEILGMAEWGIRRIRHYTTKAKE